MPLRSSKNTRTARGKLPAARDKQHPSVDDLIFWLALGLLVAVPLAFSTLVYTKYSLPKFVVLLVGASALTLLLVLRRTSFRVAGQVRIRSRLVWIVSLYFAVVGVSAIFGVAPLAAIFGSHFSFMGLITRICFLIVFVALIAGIGTSGKRLLAVLWGIAVTGFLVATYGIAQAFGVEPFVSRNLYTFASPGGPLLRVSATLGHSNYLGNFLLYTTPVGVALALTGRGWARLLATAGAALSLGAIAFSGTRGAWFGIIAGGVIFALLELRKGVASVFRNHPFAFLVSLLLAMVLAFVVLLSPPSRNVRERMSAFVDEGLSSSGRLLLWRDSLQMVPAFPFIGCGPEGFRKAFLGFKSKALGQLSRKANNESPHSAYLEAAISHGLIGAALYVAMIALTLRLLVRARRRAKDDNWRVIITGLVSSFGAVLMHNIFIFDQIATGLYFFAFIALAQATSNAATVNTAAGEKQIQTRATPGKRGFLSGALTIGACLLIVGSVWYSAGLVRSELAYRELLDPASSIDLTKLVELGDRITSSTLPTGAYDFIFARAIDTFLRKLSASSNASGGQANAVEVDAICNSATALAISHVEKSLKHSLTPELNYSLLASLALASGNVDKLRDAASEAVRWDPNNYQTRTLMAEAYLVRGERDQAAREAEIALSLYYASRKAASVLIRAKGEDPTDESAIARLMAQSRLSNRSISRSVEELIAEARRLAQTNKLKKARIMLLTASLKSDGRCPDCHRELAIINERTGRISEAIAQWEKFIELAPNRAADEKIRPRVDALRQKKIPGS